MNAATATENQTDRRNARADASRSRLGVWLDQHLFAFVSSLGRAVRRPWATLLTVGVMAIALALPLGLALALANLQHFTGSVQESRRIDLFLKADIGIDRARALVEELRARGDVASVELRTPEQGLAEFREASGLGEALDALDGNPLPSRLLVVPAQDDAQLAAALQNLPEADLVQHDAVWRQRLQGWLRFGARLTWVLAAVFGLGALLVVGNTVRLDIQSRREEIGVLQLLGASDAFIRRPFVYLGAWYGLAAGALALGLVAAAGYALRGPLAALADSYGSHFSLGGMDPLRAGAILLAATIIGWLGAWLVTGHFLRQTRPVGT
ncbi:cell division protein FtsX [Pseudoxanthomonas kalamensis DSM 18571]|uniref:permease-like cell division protein FtsX n=1 Tax=Pseudoxanthomonas kalamensis TaxID=289483 RepID=UPI001390742B|nr:permease-like cell division protein FtsX [Pseudoxanthomonas kalamensis]KAF1712471.1 cell division protein FtsX [Pseudoxanthomonas kalamensis DSM 18571]